MTEQFRSSWRREQCQNVVAFNHAENFHRSPMAYYIKMLIARKIRIIWVRLQRHDHDTRNIRPSQVKFYENMRSHPVFTTNGDHANSPVTPSCENASPLVFDQLTNDANVCECRVRIDQSIGDAGERQETIKGHEGVEERNEIQQADAIEVVMGQKFDGDVNENSDDSCIKSPSSLTESTSISTDRAKTDKGDKEAKSSARRFSFKRFIPSRLSLTVNRRQRDSWFIQKPEYQCHNAKHVMEMVFYDVQ